MELRAELSLRQMSVTGPSSPFRGRAEHGSSARVLQTSIFSAISIASSISMPRYRTVLSILLPAGNRIDYVPRRTMSRTGVAPLAKGENGMRSGT